MKKTIFQLLIAISAIVICANFSEQKSTRKERPDINFSGTIVTQAGEKMKVENITIGGKYEQINAFSKPAPSMDPKKNLISLDLDEISQISIQDLKKSLFSYQPSKEIISQKDDDREYKKITPKPIEYIEFNVTYKNGETRNYLIERDKKIWFDEMIGENRIEHRPHIEAVERIIMGKATSAKDEDQTSKKKISPAEALTEQQTKNSISETVNQLEKAVATMPEQYSNIDHWKNKLLELIKELRDTLKRIFS